MTFKMPAEGFCETYFGPDHRWLLQSYVWQNYDLFPEFPELRRFLTFWMKKLDGPPIQNVRGRQAVTKSLFPKIFRNHRSTVSDSRLLTSDLEKLPRVTAA
jgi:uncharacterized protein Usg